MAKVGRPVMYKPEMCAAAINIMAEGASKVEVAAHLGLGSKQTVYDYMQKFPEFLDAIKKGEVLSNAWWEHHARKNLHNKDFNSVLWYMNMKNRFNWSDKVESTNHHTIKQEDALELLG